MYQHQLHQHINSLLLQHKINVAEQDNSFYNRFIANISVIKSLYDELYANNENSNIVFEELLQTLITGYLNREDWLKEKDKNKQEKGNWFLSNELIGMSLYVDRFCNNLNNLSSKIDYLKNVGVNFLHLMPLFESPAKESDGGYAVSNFRKIDNRFGTLEDLQKLIKTLNKENFYLMLDIVLNHTSNQHEWAIKAKEGNIQYQDYFYMYEDRTIPNAFEKVMPEIFPEAAPGNFTWDEECKKWVMTVFHNYQWDLNFTNPKVFVEMLDNVLFYANLGVDILRIDAPAFIWKELGTTCQNLPKAHTILRLLKQCVLVVAPGMSLLGEAIVAPKEILKYFGTDNYTANECDFAYNATQMALQWDALATGDSRIMLNAQQDLLQKPFGTSWITYTRCHDDIGLGYDDWMITQAGFNAYEHRKYLKEFYGGVHPLSTASGALFSVNNKTQDARISGTLASLCGLENAIDDNDSEAINMAINKIILMQAQSFFIGGIPMLFYGDEVGYTNDYSYLQDEGRSYDNRWMHRPLIDWNKNNRYQTKGSVEEKIFSATKKLSSIRKSLPILADYKNIHWLTPYNIHVAGFIRTLNGKELYCFFNFKSTASYVTWYALKETGNDYSIVYDYWTETTQPIGSDNEYLVIEPYSFCLLQPA
jgi:amylosucrase